MDTASVTALLQSGRIRHIPWDEEANKYARLCLPSILDMESLSLVENKYTDASSTAATTKKSLTTLLKLLPASLQTLRLEQDDLGSLLPPLAAAANHFQRQGNLEHLELILTERKITHQDAKYFRDIVKMPQTSLLVSFTPQQDDFEAVLHALQQGMEEMTDTDRPKIIFRKVTLPDHETLLAQFAIQVCETNVIAALQLHPYRQLTTYRYTDCRVDATFFRGLIILLQSTQLADLEITHIEASLELRQQNSDEVWESLKQAIATNTTLKRLALRSTRSLKELWIHAIFPALATTNRTLQCLEFAHVHTTAVTTAFLTHLPQMRGLRYVRAPARQTFGRLWLRTLETMAPTDLSVEFSLGAFSAFGDYHDGAIEALLRRNRLLVRAEALVKREGGVDGHNVGIQALADFGQNEQGLSAVYVILRSSLSLF